MNISKRENGNFNITHKLDRAFPHRELVCRIKRKKSDVPMLGKIKAEEELEGISENMENKKDMDLISEVASLLESSSYFCGNRMLL